MSDWFQWAIIAFIVIVLLYHVWKGGGESREHRVARPQGQRAQRPGFCVEHPRGHVAKDISLLRELIDERLKSQKELSEATNRNVQRIYDIMLEKGLGK
jgi:hypothetical protein